LVVTYDRQTINSPNPLARFSHRSRTSKSVNLACECLPEGGTVVDFGAGTGLMLCKLGDVRPDVKLLAISRYMPPTPDPRLRYLADLRDAAGQSVDLVTALEVCEHLADAELDDFLATTAMLLRDGGFLIVSVPIMIGPVVIIKEINRMLLHRRISDMSFGEMARHVLGLQLTRAENRGTSHKGFDYRWLRRQLQQGFLIVREFYSPLPLPWWLNSQAFFICQPKKP